MAWYVYVTDQCKEAAKKHSVTQRVKQFQQEVEQLQATSLARFYQFPTPYLVKKKFAVYEGRLIASRKDLLVDGEEHTVIIFLDYMTRGDDAYEGKSGFGHDPEGYGRKHYNGGDFPEDILNDYIRNRTEKEPVQEMPRPSNEELGFLYAPLQREDFGGRMIYESIEWASAINREEYRGSLRSISEKIGSSDQKRFLVYNNCEILQYTFDDLDIRFLAGIGTPSKLDELQKEFDQYFSGKSTVKLLDAIAQKSRHAYPELLLADYALWESIETNNTGNMALSPEEGTLLDDIRKKGDGAYPLFINGRAGSGKSTILQYLFTDYLDFYLRENLSRSDINPPLYLTCNDRLLEKAKESVQQFLLCSSTQTTGKPYTKAGLNSNPEFVNAFQPFYIYLKKLIPKSEQHLFSPGNHIKYSDFIRLWKDRYKEPIDVTPEVAWHVIRTFIKGNNIEDFLTTDEYTNSLPREEHTVTNENYQFIFDEVWTKWYKTLTVKSTDEDMPGEYWDDQDLVRFVVRKNYFSKTYPVVFCDEAQDFTRIELNCILNMSLFSHRKTYSHETTKIPFAFAGDPFQTLNPTGFRWEATKVSFVEQFINSHSFDNRSAVPDINFRELGNNYRSQQNIVGFCNCVQGIRSHVLDEKFSPQTPWFFEKNALPAVYYDEMNKSFWEWVKKRQDVVFVVPCNEGEEEKYWSQNPALHENVEKSDVMSVIAIKGLEYKNIVAYGFGQKMYSRKISKLWCDDDRPEQDEKIALEYFLNKLYVAVSRAQQRLLIVDPKSAHDEFWKIFEESKITQDRLEAEATAPHITYLGVGDNSLLSDSNGNIKELAAQYKGDGMREGNPAMLKAAADKFKVLGQKSEMNECLCWAAFFSEDYASAIALDENSDFTFKHQCRWLRGRKDDLEQILADVKAGSITDFKSKIEYHLIERCFAKTLKKQVAVTLQGIHKAYTDDDVDLYEQEKSTEAWRILVAEVMKAIVNEPQCAAKDKESIWSCVVELEKLELCHDRELLIKFAASMEKWKEIVAYIEGSKIKQYSPELQKILAEATKKATPLPQLIRDAYNKKAYSEILDLCANSPKKVDLSMQEEQMVAFAYAINHQFDRLEEILRRECPDEKFQSALRDIDLPKREKELVQKYLLQTNLAAGNWDSVRKNMLRDYKKKKNADSFEDFVLLLAYVDPERLHNEAKGKHLNEFSDFMRWFLEKADKNFIRMNFIEIGCALEKLNNINDSKRFYNNVSKFLGEADRAWVKHRLIICHERHARLLPNDRERDIQIRKANELRSELGIGDKPVGTPGLPQYECGSDPWFCEKPTRPKNVFGDVVIDKTKTEEPAPVVKPLDEPPTAVPVSEPVVVEKMPETKTAEDAAPVTPETIEVPVNNMEESKAPQESAPVAAFPNNVVFNTEFFDSTLTKDEDICLGDWKITRYFNFGNINIEHTVKGSTINISRGKKVTPVDDLNPIQQEDGLWIMNDGAMELDVRQYPRVRFVLHDKKMFVEFEV